MSQRSDGDVIIRFAVSMADVNGRAVRALLVWVGLIGWTGKPLHGQPAASHQSWQVKTYSVIHGLPQNTVHDLVQDSLGFLWMTTEAGVVRFDGQNLRGIEVLPERKLLASRTRGLAMSDAGDLFVDDVLGAIQQVHAHQMAIRRRDGGPRFRLTGGLRNLDAFIGLVDSFAARGRWEDAQLISTLPEGDSGLWVLYRDSLHSIGPVETQRSLPCTGCMWLIDLHGARYALMRSGMARRLAEDGMPGEPIQLVLKDGRPWLGTIQHLYWKWSYPYPLFLSQERLHRITAGAQGLVVEPLDLPGLDGTRIMSACPMNGGSMLAVGTTNQGLKLFRQHRVLPVITPDADITNNSYYSVAEIDRGWLVTVDNLHRMVLIDAAQNKARVIPGPKSLHAPGLGAVGGGRVLCSDGSGLLEWDMRSGRWAMLDSTVKGTCIYLVEADRVWVLDESRAGYLESGRFVPTGSTAGGRTWYRPQCVVRLKDGRLAYGSYEGLFIDATGEGRQFKLEPGTEDLPIRFLGQAGDCLLIGTFGEGLLIRERDGSLRQATQDPWGAMSHVHAVLEHGQDLWLSTNRGLLRVDKRALLEAPGPHQGAVRFNLYGQETGIFNQEFNGGCSPSAVALSDGTLAFPSLCGIVRVDPEQLRYPLPSHDILLGRIWVDDAPMRINTKPEYPARTRSLALEVAMAYFDDQGEALYEYRIPGLVENWTPLARQQDRITIDRPGSGRFELLIRPIGAADEPEPMWYFRILPPWYATLPGVALLALAAVAIGFAGMRLNSARLRRKNQMLERYAQAFSQELAERNQQLGEPLRNRETLLSIVSHDIVTPLRFVARVARQAEKLRLDGRHPERLKETLVELSSSADKLHVNAIAALDWLRMNPERITVRKAPTDLERLVSTAAELWHEMAESRGIAVVNEVPAGTVIETDPQLVQVILNNLLGNCVGHNIHATRVWFRVAAEQGQVVLTVEDNGTGMPPAVLQQAERMLKGSAKSPLDRFLQGDALGLGFSIIGSLVSLLGAEASLRSDGTGTTISIRFPRPGNAKE